MVKMPSLHISFHPDVQRIRAAEWKNADSPEAAAIVRARWEHENRTRATAWENAVSAEEVLRLLGKWYPHDQEIQKQLQRMLQTAPATASDTCAPATGDGVESRLKRLEDFIFGTDRQGLAATIAAIVAKGVRIALGGSLKYCGIWDETTDYSRNSIITHNGSAWIALRDSKGDRPGSTGSWRLMVKSDQSALKRIVRSELHKAS
jgi:hypothetical protein